MNELVILTETIIKKLVKDIDAVSVKEFDSDDEDVILIEVMVSSEDMGRVIGQNGKIINSIRTIVQASSYIGENKRVQINIDSF